MCGFQGFFVFFCIVEVQTLTTSLVPELQSGLGSLAEQATGMMNELYLLCST